MTSSPPISFDDLVEKIRKELMSQVEREQANLLEETFTQTIKFLPPPPSSRNLIALWLQVPLSVERGRLRTLTVVTDSKKQESFG